MAAATLTCEFLSSNSFEIASMSSGSSTASKGGVGPFVLSNIIPVHEVNREKYFIVNVNL